MKPFKILSKEVLIHSPYMPVEKQMVELPNGEISEWFVNTHGDAVIVLAITTNNEIILERCYKHGCQQIVTEFCAGMVEKGELPLEAAKREFREETGYKVGTIKKVGEVYSNPTGSNMKYHFFLATECEYDGEQRLDGAEQIEILLLQNMQELEKLVFDPNENPACISLAGITYLRKYWSKEDL
jgi:ADP-ribose pyrophosphatase